MRRATWTLLTAMLLSLHGCADKRSQDLEARLSIVERDLADAKEAAATLRKDFDAAELSGDDASYASISTTERNYAVVRSDHGLLTVSAKAAVPELDGFRVTLEFGNLGAATLTGAKINVLYGAREAKTIRIKSVDTPKDFRPGSFTSVDVVLAPAKAEEIRKIDVAVSFSQVQMGRSR